MRTVYGIRHMPSGNFMPVRMFKQSGAGFSWWEPSDTCPGYQPFDPNPRLFFSLRSAKAALRMWLRGPLRKTWVDTSGHEMADDFCAGSGFHTLMPADDGTGKHRWPQDMEIVTFNLTAVEK